MGRFLHHEPIASGMLNSCHNAKSSATEAWESELQCTDDLVNLVLARMEADYLALHVKMRKPFSSKDIVPRFDFRPGFTWTCPLCEFLEPRELTLPEANQFGLHISGDFGTLSRCIPGL